MACFANGIHSLAATFTASATLKPCENPA